MLKTIGAAIAAMGIGLGSQAQAQTYPSKPITMIVPFAPGGTVNLMGRLLANRMSEALGQTFVVENKTGANSNIGAEAVARAPADGYTLCRTTRSRTWTPSRC
ncbi:hypothetical protein G6F50_017568 [Rhizopus delemar]|uniref:Uncharacterized protein n=1 Tax=Rhizopus delemar TaxID=936053 RepID=A0A9P6XQ23_9FUNG|nr:hypothetical protein G6F50_017568 [Rhizopus delemar]